MAPVLLANKGPDCVLAKQPEVKITSHAVITPIDESTKKTTHTESSEETITTTTTTTTGFSMGGWQYTGAKKSRTFECEYPTTNANVNRVLEPLPFPKKLSQVIAWTDAFVDRIAIMTHEQEEETKIEIARFTRDIKDLQITVDRKIVTINDQKKTIEDKDREIADLTRRLQASRTESEKKSVTITTLEKTITDLKLKHAEEIRKWVAENAKDDKEIADKDKHIREDHKKLEIEIKARQELEAKLRQAHIDIATRDTTIESLKSEVKRLTIAIAAHLTTILELERKIKIEVETHNCTTRKYTDALEVIEKLKKELAEAKIKADEACKAHDDAEAKSGEKIKTLETTIREITVIKEKLEVEIKTVKTELTKTTTELTKTTTQVTKSKSMEKYWQGKFNDEEKRRVSEEIDLNKRLKVEQDLRKQEQAAYDEIIAKEKADYNIDIAEKDKTIKELEAIIAGGEDDTTTTITTESGSTTTESGSTTTTTGSISQSKETTKDVTKTTTSTSS